MDAAGTPLASRLVVGWLDNAADASVLIAWLFHAMHNALVNPTDLGVAVLGLPQVGNPCHPGGHVILAGQVVAAAM